MVRYMDGFKILLLGTNLEHTKEALNSISIIKGQFILNLCQYFVLNKTVLSMEGFNILLLGTNL